MNSVVNFRDIGGFPTQQGTVVKTGHFFRSGELVNIAQADQQKLVEDYQIKRIYDFKSAAETQERPDDSIQGTNYLHIDILADIQAQTASLEGMLKTVGSPDEAMDMAYKEMVLSNSGRKGYQTFFENFLSYPQEAILFHCFAGKDRTGIGAALILSALGVEHSYILEDYLKTNEQRKTANEQIIAQYQANGTPPAEIQQLETLLYVKKEYLATALQAIEKEFGSVEGYLKEGLGLPLSAKKDMLSLYTKS